MKTTETTVEELNDIQAKWMALDSNAPEKEKQEVFRLMRNLPQSYFSVNRAKTHGTPMVSEQPLTARALPLAEVREYYPTIQTRFAWCGAEGKWVTL